MHMAFLITWGCPPAAGETHLGTKRNACAKSKGGWEGWALMRGISGTRLIVTFLLGTAGLSMKVGPLPQGPLHHSALSSSCNRARHSKTSSPSNRRQLKLWSAYTPGNTWLATIGREGGRGGAWGRSLGEGWWNLFVSRNGKKWWSRISSVGRLLQHTIFLQTLNSCINKENRWGFSTKHKKATLAGGGEWVAKQDTIK